MKTIVIEALSAREGGGQTYLLELLRNLPQALLQQFRVVLIVPEDFKQRLVLPAGVEVLAPRWPAKTILHRIAWLWLCFPRLLRRLAACTVFFPGGTVPGSVPRGIHTAVTHQNMLPFDARERRRFPLGLLRTKLWLLGFVQAASFRSASLLIFISEHGKAGVRRRVRRAGGRELLVPHGVDQRFRCASMQRPAALQKHEYVLYVSKLDFYKAQCEVVSAWAALRDLRRTTEKLVLVGPENADYARKVRRTIEFFGMKDEVLILGNVGYEELPSFYQHAKINVFASSCETCPNILLEALAAGKLVLCSRYPPMPEFAGDAAMYFDPYDTDELARLLKTCLDDEALAATMGSAASARAAAYDWCETAATTWGAIGALARS